MSACHYKMRQDTAPQLATRLRSYTIRWDTGPRAVYTCQQSQFLADWQHQQVNRTGTSAFPRCAGQLVAKAKRRAAAEVYTPGREKQRAAGRRGPYYNATCVSAFRRKNGRLYARPHNGGSAALQRSGFRENPTNILTFVAR